MIAVPYSMDRSDSGFQQGVATSGALSTPPCSRRSSMHISRKTSWGTPIPPPSTQTGPTSASKDDHFDEVDLNARTGASSDSANSPGWNTLDNIAALGLSFNVDADSPLPSTTRRERFSLDDTAQYENLLLPLEDRPFNKWIKNLQRRATQRRRTVCCDLDSSAFEQEFLESPIIRARIGHKKSSSGSSFGFVTAVKSASISLASFSVAPRSRRTGVSSRQHRTDRSSKASVVGRLSEDSSYVARVLVIDQAVENRLFQRRRILEELISTEESYVGDVKFLMNVYVTLLASIPSLSLSLRASINRNLNEIVELHEDLLGDLHRVVPHSEYTQFDCAEPGLTTVSTGHHRWRSLDAVPENAGNGSWLQKVPGMTAEPKIAAEAAKVFGKKINRFFVYEEYGAKYELMIKDVASAHRTIPQWELYQKGLEALASSLASINAQRDKLKKALTIGDLLVKPIQRVCKYPLLFSELLKQTPVCDCPDSHMEIEKVLMRLREATTKINRATDDPQMKVTVEKSWLLQDRLVFPDMPEARSTTSIRALGHIHLCGVLHVSWQTNDSVDGQYLICLLYRDFLLLASAVRTEQTYKVQACIELSELKIEEVDNGRGLQCHTAPFSWKLVFEYDHRLFEITMSACSLKEELEWRSRLVDHCCSDPIDSGEKAVFTSLSLAIKPMGTIFGKPGTIARRISIQRATTVGPMSGLCQVIIKNTSALKETTSSGSINRSQSLLMTNRIPILAASRAERIRIEALLADVWTREVLPFPGMTSRARNENLVRASANSMMRKLSVASITSNFTKRSGSMASLHKTTGDDESAESEIPNSMPLGYESHFSETVVPPDAVEDDFIARLSVIHDERDSFKQTSSLEALPILPLGSNSCPAGTSRRSTTLKVKKSWAPDRQRIITPPLRASSANSMNHNRAATPLSTVTDLIIEDKENIPQVHPTQTEEPEQKRVKKSKGLGVNRDVITEGLRNLFR